MNNEMLAAEWNKVCLLIDSYEDVDSSQVHAFFSRLQPQAMSDGFLMLTADNSFIKTWIERHYSQVIARALYDIHGISYNIVIEIDYSQEASSSEPSSFNQASSTSAQTSSTSAQATSLSAQTTPVPTIEKEDASSIFSQPTPVYTDIYTEEISSHANPYTNVDEDYLPEPISIEPVVDTDHYPFGNESTLTFESFVIGDSNRMAYSMAVAVAEAPGKSPINPLFIYGKSGLGKTHLLRAIQNYINTTQPYLSTIYITSEELLNDYMEASLAHDKEKTSFKSFKTRYEAADVLLIDDIERLQGKRQTLDTVFQIFNKLTSQGKQIVLSADRAPKTIDIDERYKSRFNSGGTIDIQPPEVETKLGIIKSFVDQYTNDEGISHFTLSQDIQSYIAEISGSNIRELRSAITRVIYQMAFFKTSDLSLDEVRSILEHHFTSGSLKKISVSDIQAVVEEYYGVTHEELIGDSRKRPISYARSVCVYLSRQLIDIPFRGIGEYFNNRDHSSIHYLYSIAEERLQKKQEFREEIESLKQLIFEN